MPQGCIYQAPNDVILVQVLVATPRFIAEFSNIGPSLESRFPANYGIADCKSFRSCDTIQDQSYALDEA